MTSDVATPEVDTVTGLAQEPEEIADVPSAADPFAIVWVTLFKNAPVPNGVPLLFVQVITPVLTTAVQSPVIVNPANAPDKLY
jgi:hypothetical protein